jgi:hypothetical protein
MVWFCLLDDLNQLCGCRIYVFSWSDQMGCQKSKLIRIIFYRSGGWIPHWATRNVNSSKDFNYRYGLGGKTKRYSGGLRRNLRPFACWDYGFESRRGHGCLVSFQCRVSSGRVPCGGQISRLEQSYRERACVYVRACECYWVWSGETVTFYTYT